MMDELYFPDLGNGQYRNPVLFCDYSDPDVIRVGDTYYMTASSFNYVPGLPILVSKDLVNWELVNYALKHIPAPGYDRPRHACGVWAPAIRWHEGFFYICYGMPDEGIYMVRTRDPLGDWEEPALLLPGKGLIDPCPFWDEDGKAYIIHGYANSRIGFKSWLGIFPISADGMRAIGEDHLLFDGTKNHPTIEGPKVHKRDGWYYIFAPAGGVATGWQTVLRSRSIHGPYEDRIVLRQGDSLVNGPHQGAWVDTPAGQSWFIHFQSRGLYGRIIHLQPMAWGADGWPVIGEAAAGETWGVPVDVWEKPEGPACQPLSQQASDDFTGPLGLQWQFMGNAQADFCRVGDGTLLLPALNAQDNLLWNCPHALTQKIAAPAFTAEVSLDASMLKAGEQAGFGLVGGQYVYAALRRTKAGLKLVYVQSAGGDHRETVLDEKAVSAEQLQLRMTLLPTGYDEAVMTLEYAADGKWRWIGMPFYPERHTWVGARLALFAMSMDGENHGGQAAFGPFEVTGIETLD